MKCLVDGSADLSTTAVALAMGTHEQEWLRYGPWRSCARAERGQIKGQQVCIARVIQTPYPPLLELYDVRRPGCGVLGSPAQ